MKRGEDALFWTFGLATLASLLVTPAICWLLFPSNCFPSFKCFQGRRHNFPLLDLRSAYVCISSSLTFLKYINAEFWLWYLVFELLYYLSPEPLHPNAKKPIFSFLQISLFLRFPVPAERCKIKSFTNHVFSKICLSL